MKPVTIVQDNYEWDGRRERLVRAGVGDTRLLILAPLFEEANKTRRFLIETMRVLSVRGISSALPDLPGTLESTARLDETNWNDWTGAVSAAARTSDAQFVASFRGGALLDGIEGVQGHWRLAPADGRALLRDLVRVQLASQREEGMTATAAEIERKALGEPITIAGYSFAPGFLAAMQRAGTERSGALRIARLATDAQPADVKFEGTPLWRRSEPGEDRALSQAVANDIADWIATCDAR